MLVKLTDDGRVVVLGADYADGSDSSSTASGSGSDSGLEPDSDSSLDADLTSNTEVTNSSSNSMSGSSGNSGSGSNRSSRSSSAVGAGITGLRWFFKPGPAHLDTLEFSIVSDASSSPDVFLRYTGFIDRYVRGLVLLIARNEEALCDCVCVYACVVLGYTWFIDRFMAGLLCQCVIEVYGI